MSTYRKEWPCCGSATYTDGYEPEECPFCRNATLERSNKELREALEMIANGTTVPATVARAALSAADAKGEKG